MTITIQWQVQDARDAYTNRTVENVKAWEVHGDVLHMEHPDGSMTLLRGWIGLAITPDVQVNAPAAPTTGVHDYMEGGGNGVCAAIVVGAGGRHELCALPRSHALHGGPGEPVALQDQAYLAERFTMVEKDAPR